MICPYCYYIYNLIKAILIGTLKRSISKEAFYNVNYVRTNFDMNLGWLNGLRSEESICY